MSVSMTPANLLRACLCLLYADEHAVFLRWLRHIHLTLLTVSVVSACVARQDRGHIIDNLDDIDACSVDC
jgi:hypothetical protein